MCGGTRAWGGAKGARRGLSPRVRGNLEWPHRRMVLTGSIPACAGEPVDADNWNQALGGLSPRVRGNPTPGLTAN